MKDVLWQRPHFKHKESQPTQDLVRQEMTSPRTILHLRGQFPNHSYLLSLGYHYLKESFIISFFFSRQRVLKMLHKGFIFLWIFKWGKQEDQPKPMKPRMTCTNILKTLLLHKVALWCVRLGSAQVQTLHLKHNKTMANGTQWPHFTVFQSTHTHKKSGGHWKVSPNFYGFSFPRPQTTALSRSSSIPKGAPGHWYANVSDKHPIWP